MNISKFQKIIIIASIILTSLSFMVIQLNSLAVDTSLKEWQEGVPGYVSSLREQKETNKPIALFFYTDWCASCEKLRKEVLSSPEVSEYMSNLLPVKINPERGALENQISDEFGVVGYPTIIVIPGGNNGERAPIRIKRTHNISPAQFIEQFKQALAAA